jgi:hypothetical protein
MYVLVPTNVLAIELISSPDTPKSQILISPFELAKILDGLMSGVREALGSPSSYAPRWIMRCTSYRYTRPLKTASATLPTISSGTAPV